MSTPITAAHVNELRHRTSRPMMECKNALIEADGDMEKAEEILRKKGHVAKADRETAEGRIAVSIDPAKQVGAMVEVLCESAPVAKSELFVAAGQRPGQAGGHRGRRPRRRNCWPSRSSATRRRPCRTASARSSA